MCWIICRHWTSSVHVCDSGRYHIASSCNIPVMIQGVGVVSISLGGLRLSSSSIHTSTSPLKFAFLFIPYFELSDNVNACCCGIACFDIHGHGLKKLRSCDPPPHPLSPNLLDMILQTGLNGLRLLIALHHARECLNGVPAKITNNYLFLCNGSGLRNASSTC